MWKEGIRVPIPQRTGKETHTKGQTFNLKTIYSIIGK